MLIDINGMIGNNSTKRPLKLLEYENKALTRCVVEKECRRVACK